MKDERPRLRAADATELRRDQLELQFDQLGSEEWELAWVLMNQALHGEKDGHVVSASARFLTSGALS